MRRLFLLLVMACCATASQAQMGDFISLKRANNRHVASYFKGSRIEFQHVNGQYINGPIEAVRNDSIFVRQWQIVSYITQLGTSKVDTLGSMVYGLHYQEIFKIIHNKKEGWGFVKNGSIFMIGGVGYAVLNLINGAYRKEPIGDPANLRSLGIAGAVAGGGFLLNRLHRHREKKGKNYKIVYVKMTDK
ncbi:hypothetical protein [Flavihumibacter sp. CACIAM 22H1]|uniref:hypothetical protein n=1 Tax=Flavihumibacter sp. CACIAM 22H1 TaxID=1812911 RepID=UPI000A8E2F43|nr:hypothetical protein [Flavihumibacter sp. CACIAM 22H1]